MTQILNPALLPQNLFQAPISDQQGFCRSKVWQYFFQVVGTPAQVQQVLTGTHASRLTTDASGYVDGSYYYETDRTVWYIAQGSQWLYFAGTYRDSSSNMPQDLAAGDAGFLFFATDYAHHFCWAVDAMSGILEWGWAPGEMGGDFIVSFVTGPDDRTGWHACDGSTTTRITNRGSIVAATLPNTAGAWYRQ